jgi:hypothetical protein
MTLRVFTTGAFDGSRTVERCLGSPISLDEDVLRHRRGLRLLLDDLVPDDERLHAVAHGRCSLDGHPARLLDARDDLVGAGIPKPPRPARLRCLVLILGLQVDS